MYRVLAALLLALAAQAAQAFPSYANGDGFRGAQLLSPEERQLHVAKLQSMQTFGECTAYMEAHEVELQKRA